MSGGARSRARQSFALVGVAVLRVDRHGDRRSVRDLEVDIRCRGAVPAPGTGAALRAAVYSLTARGENRTPETLAAAIARHCRDQLGVEAKVQVDVRARAWGHLDVGGRLRGADLATERAATRVARAVLVRGRERVSGGFRDLQLLSPDDAEGGALEIVTLHARWRYGWPEIPYDTQWQQVRRAVTEAYAELDRTPAGLPLAIGRAVLAESPAVDAIEVRLERAARRPIAAAQSERDDSGETHGEAVGGSLIQTARVQREELRA